jgi:transcriptional regulator with GAF, ATPase, and Fis domain
VAGEGTLFLDEIGDMPMIMQVKLLRVLQEKEFERLGSNQLRPFKARVICATHRCLKTMVADKYFRDDLYYRLNVLPLYLPPLRQRLDDLQLLIEQITHKEGMKITFTTDALELLRGYSWPGNIRELCNILYRADVFFHEKHLTAQEVKTLFDDSVKFSN